MKYCRRGLIWIVTRDRIIFIYRRDKHVFVIESGIKRFELYFVTVSLVYKCYTNCNVNFWHLIILSRNSQGDILLFLASIKEIEKLAWEHILCLSSPSSKSQWRALHASEETQIKPKFVLSNTLEISDCRDIRLSSSILATQKSFLINPSLISAFCFLSGYAKDGSARGFRWSTVGSRDHGSRGAEFPSRWHHHRSNYDVMWLVVWPSGRSGGMVSCTVCSGKSKM